MLFYDISRVSQGDNGLLMLLIFRSMGAHNEVQATPSRLITANLLPQCLQLKIIIGDASFLFGRSRQLISLLHEKQKP